MSKSLSKAAQKVADAEALAQKVKLAMNEAQQAAAAAFTNFAKTAPRTPDGHIKDSCGGAYVYARKPSYAFRRAMVEAGAMERSFNGQWDIGRFQHVVSDQSITGAETACNAACEVLKKYFPDEPIHTSSYID